MMNPNIRTMCALCAFSLAAACGGSQEQSQMPEQTGPGTGGDVGTAGGPGSGDMGDPGTGTPSTDTPPSEDEGTSTGPTPGTGAGTNGQ